MLSVPSSFDQFECLPTSGIAAHFDKFAHDGRACDGADGGVVVFPRPFCSFNPQTVKGKHDLFEGQFTTMQACS